MQRMGDVATQLDRGSSGNVVLNLVQSRRAWSIHGLQYGTRSRLRPRPRPWTRASVRPCGGSNLCTEQTAELCSISKRAVPQSAMPVLVFVRCVVV